ncbi:MAG: SgcJ/EcaC family oxidoreductase [Gemmatimonadales bacterium]
MEAIVRDLEAAWNAMDAEAFAAPFTEDADFVNIVGEHHRGRAAIVEGHRAIFRDFYANSTARMKVLAVRLLGPDVALAHVHSVLDAPKGPLAGRNAALFSMVLTKTRRGGGDGWEIAAFHNTRQMARGRRPPADKDLDA